MPPPSSGLRSTMAMHGAPHYLIKDGWKPLLNGRDLTGWKSQNSGHNDWMTTTGILFERLPGPTRLRAVPGLVLARRSITEEKLGDMKLYLEFMITKGSSSGVYLHVPYEVQVFDSWASYSRSRHHLRRHYGRLGSDPQCVAPPRRMAIVI